MRPLDTKAVNTYAAQAHDATIIGFLMNIIPDTIVGAFAKGDILQVLFFSVFFGIALGAVGERGRVVSISFRPLRPRSFVSSPS